MSLLPFLLILILSGVAIAAVIDHKYPKLRPGLSWLLIALVLSTFVITSVSGPILVWCHGWAGDFGVAIGGTAMFAYFFLVALWAFRAAIDQLGGSGGGGIRSEV